MDFGELIATALSARPGTIIHAEHVNDADSPDAFEIKSIDGHVVTKGNENVN